MASKYVPFADADSVERTEHQLRNFDAIELLEAASNKEDENNSADRIEIGVADGGMPPSTHENNNNDNAKRYFGFTPYQCLVIFAAWLGWGFDQFDSLLMVYAAPTFVPYMLKIPADQTDQIKQSVSYWTAIFSSILLVGWSCGGVLFGLLTDKFGRSRMMLATVLLYSIATAACAFAPNLYVVCVLRFFSSLGIGGEWSAGSVLVAESVPMDKRVFSGAVLFTAAPCGAMLAMMINYLFNAAIGPISNNASLSWRFVFLSSLIPTAVAVLIRFKVKEPERWVNDKKAMLVSENEGDNKSSNNNNNNNMIQLFTRPFARKTIGATLMVVVVLITWYCINSFTAVIAGYLASQHQFVDANGDVDPQQRRRDLAAQYQLIGVMTTQVGSIVGSLLIIPIAKRVGRLWLIRGLLAGGSACVFLTFLTPGIPAPLRLAMHFLISIFLTPCFAVFTFYLPELYPTKLRGTGSGFCYNISRIFTSPFPFITGAVLRAMPGASPLFVIAWTGVIPMIGIFLSLVAVETHGILYEEEEEEGVGHNQNHHHLQQE